MKLINEKHYMDFFIIEACCFIVVFPLFLFYFTFLMLFSIEEGHIF